MAEMISDVASYIFAFCGAQVTSTMTWGQDGLFELTCKFISSKYKFYVYLYIIHIYINIEFIKLTVAFSVFSVTSLYLSEFHMMKTCLNSWLVFIIFISF